MPRGRSIDPHLPVTRSIQTQREFRARRNAKLQNLESEVERLSRENDELRREVQFLRARTQGDGLQDVGRAREQVAAALRALDGVLSPLPTPRPDPVPQPRSGGCCPPTSNPAPQCAPSASKCGPSATQCGPAASQCGSAGSSRPLSAAPATPTSPAGPPSATQPISAARTESGRQTPTFRPRPSGDDGECCGGLFDCDAMIRSAVDPMQPQ